MPGNPKYRKPPVVETVMGVQFPEIDGFRAVHFGLFWETLRDRYPKITDQPRLKPVREVFPRRPALPEFEFRATPKYPVDRVWFEAASASELIQLQPDRFLFNWRQRKDEPYPSYEQNSNTFFSDFAAFCTFCRNQKLPEPTPELCEVTYVNHVLPGEDESAVELAGKLFSGHHWETIEGFLPTPEAFTYNRVFVIQRDGKAAGRLYAESCIATNRVESKWREFVLLNLTARVNHAAGDELKESLQLAHDWVVRGFADLTDPEIQKKRWEKRTE